MVQPACLFPTTTSLLTPISSHPKPSHLSQHSNLCQPTFSRHSTMTTPPITILSPHPLPAPVLEPTAADSDSFMPVLSLPPSVATARNALPLTTSSGISSSTTNHHPVSVLATATQHFPMTISFYPVQSSIESCTIPVRNSSRHVTSPLLSPTPSFDLTVAPAQVLLAANSNCTPPEAHQ